MATYPTSESSYDRFADLRVRVLRRRFRADVLMMTSAALLAIVFAISLRVLTG
jgi:hypothetical protein